MLLVGIALTSSFFIYKELKTKNKMKHFNK